MHQSVDGRQAGTPRHGAGMSGADPLAPVESTIRTTAGTTPGLSPGLYVTNRRSLRGWIGADALIDETQLDRLLGWAGARWQASPYAAATLAWKDYSYWAALPAVVGWAAVRRVPLLRPADVMVRHGGRSTLLTVGLRPSVAVAVLPTDPLACGRPSDRVVVVADETELLTALRTHLMDALFEPLMHTISTEGRVGVRALRGSVGSGVAHGLLRTVGAGHPRPSDVHTVLTALGVEDLVDVEHGPDGARVQRRTCCLAFTLPDPTTCRSCCIHRRTHRSGRDVAGSG